MRDRFDGIEKFSLFWKYVRLLTIRIHMGHNTYDMWSTKCICSLLLNRALHIKQILQMNLNVWLNYATGGDLNFKLAVNFIIVSLKIYCELGEVFWLRFMHMKNIIAQISVKATNKHCMKAARRTNNKNDHHHFF